MKRIILLAVALMVASSNDKICETKLDKMQGCVIKEYQGKVLVKETPYKNNKINGIVKSTIQARESLNLWILSRMIYLTVSKKNFMKMDSCSTLFFTKMAN